MFTLSLSTHRQSIDTSSSMSLSPASTLWVTGKRYHGLRRCRLQMRCWLQFTSRISVSTTLCPFRTGICQNVVPQMGLGRPETGGCSRERRGGSACGRRVSLSASSVALLCIPLLSALAPSRMYPLGHGWLQHCAVFPVGGVLGAPYPKYGARERTEDELGQVHPLEQEF